MAPYITPAPISSAALIPPPPSLCHSELVQHSVCDPLPQPIALSTQSFHARFAPVNPLSGIHTGSVTVRNHYVT